MELPVTRARLEELLAAVTSTRVAVLGDAMLDVYLTGDVDRISPEAPVPVVRVTASRRALGGAANVAQNLATLGVETLLIAAAGADEAGQALRSMMTELGATDKYLVQTRRRTTAKTRVVARSQQLLRIDEEHDEMLDGPELEALLAALDEAAGRCDALVLEDYNKGVLAPSVIEHAIGIGRRRGIPIIVDPKYRHFFHFAGTTVFKPNRRELEAALGSSVDLAHADAVPSIVRRLGVEYLLLTLGEHGMALFDAQREVVRLPTVARDVYDVVGAGDTVTAFLAALLAAGATVVEAAAVANVAAGIEVSKLGAATVSAEEVLAYVETIRSHTGGHG